MAASTDIALARITSGAASKRNERQARFLVPFSVGEFSEFQACSFGETPGAYVLLEDPEAQTVRTPIHRHVQQRRTHSPVLICPMHP